MEKIPKYVVALALEQVGYLEKRSARELDDHLANAGSQNYTKFARDLDEIPGFYNGKKNGYPWCDVFVDWLFVKLFRAETARNMLCQPEKSYGAGCGYSARYYKQAGRFYEPGGTGDDAPRPGDQIFFWNASRTDVAHTGLVVAVDGSFVHTVEGNTSGRAGVVDNGGGVWQKKYGLGNGRIYGYGRPRYDAIPEEPLTPEQEQEQAAADKAAAAQAQAEAAHAEFIMALQAAIGAQTDGIPGPETFGKCPTLSRYKNSRHAAVAPVQRRLHELGYTQVGDPDGIAGPKFQAAVKAFQADHRCFRDGELTARRRSWQQLLGELGL